MIAATDIQTRAADWLLERREGEWSDARQAEFDAWMKNRLPIELPIGVSMPRGAGQTCSQPCADPPSSDARNRNEKRGRIFCAQPLLCS